MTLAVFEDTDVPFGSAQIQIGLGLLGDGQVGSVQNFIGKFLGAVAMANEPVGYCLNLITAGESQGVAQFPQKPGKIKIVLQFRLVKIKLQI